MDLAEAHISALNFLKINKGQNIAINIGTGKGTSVLEIIKTFQEIKGISFPYNFAKRRIGDEPYLVADNSLAMQLLDWSQREILKICVMIMLSIYEIFKNNIFLYGTQQEE